MKIRIGKEISVESKGSNIFAEITPAIYYSLEDIYIIKDDGTEILLSQLLYKLEKLLDEHK